LAGNLTEQAARLYEVLSRFYVRFMARMTNQVMRGKISVPQYNALRALAEGGSLTMSELTRALGVTMGAATNIVNRLTNRAYTRRERGTDDRRVVRVSLTPRGKEVLRRTQEEAVGLYAEFLGYLTAGERKSLIGIYEKLDRRYAAEESAKP
jgi:DNA-binding MarR family transcriptional regulator